MISLFIFLTFLFLIITNLIFNNSYLSVDLHSVCLAYVPDTSWPDLYKALVCGKKLPDSSDKTNIQNLGLIHLFVVSGAHLHLIDKLLDWLFRKKLPFAFKISLLFVFVAFCNFQISALRAWIHIFVKKINVVFYLNYNPFQILLVSLFICLLLFPTQVFSFSLILSWGACLGLLTFHTSLSRSFLCFLILFPVVSAFSYLTPWSILFNTFLAPTVALFLFPLTLFSYCFHFLTSFTDSLWKLFFLASEELSATIGENYFPSKTIKTLPYWFYILFLHFLLENLFIKRSKK